MDMGSTATTSVQRTEEVCYNRTSAGIPILTDPFELEVDASGFAMGAVLLQKKEDCKKHPIAYFSKTLSAAE
jgi:hypothetical protein